MKLLFEIALAQRLKGVDSTQVKDAFFANYLAALLMVRLHDLKGLQLIRDPSHSKLTKFEDNMSDLNFWGRALFYPNDPLVKRSLAFGHADVLEKEAGRILQSRVQKIMQVPLTDPKHVNWGETVATLIILQHRFELKSTYFGKIAVAIQKWDTLADSAKRKAVGDSFMYLTQADPRSNLLSHMRELSGMTMLNDIKALAMKVISFRRLGECRITLSEDGEVVSTSGFGTSAMPIFGGGANNIIKPATDTASQNTAQMYGYQNKSKHQVKGANAENSDAKLKLIKKRVRKFKAIRFKAPEGFKTRRNNDE
jgi:hypothetical protein